MKTSSSPLTNVRVLLVEQGIMLWRRKWLALTVCWIACLVGWSAVVIMPRQYESNARAYIDVNGLLAPLLKGLVVDTNTTQTNDYLRQTLLSRPNLEQVIHLTGLDAGKNAIEVDALITRLSAKVRITAQARNLVSIVYRDSDPIVTKNVVEALLTIFAENGARSSRVEMEGARKFLDDQIAKYEMQLRATEKRRADFRKEYAEALADPISGVPKLQTLQQQLAQAQQRYREAKATRDSLAAQLAQVPQFRSLDAATVGPNGNVVATPAEGKLSQAKANLAQLRVKFTDQHPDVLAAQQAVAALESTPSDGKTPVTEPKIQVPNPTHEQIRMKLVDAEAAVPAAQEHLDQVVTDFERTRALSATVPDIDAKKLDLDRDYNIIKKNHDELITRRESANLSQAADDRADRTQFRIVDPPLTPRDPVFPNQPLMFSMVLSLGLGVGFGLPVLLGHLWATFTSIERLRELGFPVIGCVTYVRPAGVVRVRVLAGAGAVMIMLALLAVYGALMTVDTGEYQTMLRDVVKAAI